jgi:circadian clock protein KaiC
MAPTGTMGHAIYEPSTSENSPRQRLESGVPGLDVILGGGLLKSGVYLLAGGPGSGKTVLANQLCFARSARGDDCLYVTVLSESHGRMIGNLESLQFFDPRLVGTKITYVSGVQAIREDGLDALFELVVEEVRRRRPTVLVLDGLSIGVRFSGASEPVLNEFLNRLSALLEFHACTGLLCVLSPVGIVAAEHIMADGMIEMTHTRSGRRGVRDLFVSKFRGSWTLDGAHVFRIDQRGVTVFPRTEALLSRNVDASTPHGDRLRFGVPRLDAMLLQGIPRQSTTALVGTSGSGKTLLGLTFLAEGAKHGEQGLYFGFNESPGKILKQGDGIGLPLSALRATGTFELVSNPPVEVILDELGAELLQIVQRRKIQRVFIDGVEGFERGAIFPERAGPFVAALAVQLRTLGATTLLSVESPLLGSCSLPEPLWSPLLENIILLRHFELRSELRRLISIVKLRGSGFDASIREFAIDDTGIRVYEKFEDTERVLSGFAHPDSTGHSHDDEPSP